MNIKDVRRQLYKVQNITGWGEKTEVLTDELQSLDKHVDNIRETCHVAVKKISGILRTDGSENDKKIKKLPEHALGTSLIDTAKDLDSGLNNILLRCGLVEQQLAWEIAKYDESVEKNVIEPLRSILENDIPALQKLHKVLSKLTTDMDIASSRHAQAVKQNSQPGSSMTDAKLAVMKDELSEARKQVDRTRIQYSTEMQRFISREAEVGKYFLELLLDQKLYHETCLEIIKTNIPSVQATIEEINQPVFGVALSDHLKHTNSEIAAVIEDCVTWLQPHVCEEGIFRLSGNATTIKALKAALDNGVPLRDHPSADTHSVAGVLKQYLRELPEPLLTYSLYNDWIKVGQTPAEEKLTFLRNVILKLPKENYNNLCFLLQFLCKLAEHSDVNKMSPSNLGIVIGPNLLWPSDKSASIENTSIQSWLVEMFLTNASLLFPEIKCEKLSSGSTSSVTSDLVNSDIADNLLLASQVDSMDSSSVSSFVMGEESPSPSSVRSVGKGPPSPSLSEVTDETQLSRLRVKKQAPPSPQSGRIAEAHIETYDNITDPSPFSPAAVTTPDIKQKRLGTIEDSPDTLPSTTPEEAVIMRSSLLRNKPKVSSGEGEPRQSLSLSRVSSLQLPKTQSSLHGKPRRPPPPPPTTLRRNLSNDVDATNPFCTPGSDDNNVSSQQLQSP